jgi:hypothetical protein
MRVFKVGTGDERMRVRVRVGERFAIEMDGDDLLGSRWSLTPGRRTSVLQEEVRGLTGSGSSRRRFVLQGDQAGEEVIVAAFGRGGQPSPTMGLWLHVDISE